MLVAALTVGRFAPSVGLLNGMGDLGPVVDAGQPLARGVALAAGAMTVGHLLLAAVYRPGECQGAVSSEGYRALHAVRGWALLQVGASLVAALLTIAESTAITPAALLTRPALLTADAAAFAPAIGWLATAAGATLVAIGALVALSWRTATGLLVLALAAMTPTTLTTATDADSSHDIVGDAITLHALGALVWLGSAVVVALHLARGGSRPDVVLRRHSCVATVSVLVLAYSGIATLTVTLPAAAVFTTAYGLLVVTSAALMLGAALAAIRLRSTLRGRGGALGLLTIEAGLLMAAAGTGIALQRLSPPGQQDYIPTRLVYLIGYDLPGRLTITELALHWRWDVVLGPTAVLAAGGYLAGVRLLVARGGSWPSRRTAAWLAGCTVLLVASSSGIGAYAPAMFSLHMVQHMLLATLVPVLLLLGHPISLVSGLTGPRGRARIESLLDAPALRAVRHPVVALTAVGGTLFALYPTGLYGAILQEHWAHIGMDVAFLGTGLVLYWPVLGRALPGGGLPALGRIVIVFAVMGLHAAFAVWLLAQPSPVAAPFFSSVQLPFVPDLLADQRRGAVMSWILGEVPTVIAVAALVTTWNRSDRDDRPAWQPAGPDGVPDLHLRSALPR